MNPRAVALRLIAPRGYALIGAGSLLLFIGDYFSITVEQAHALTWAAPLTLVGTVAGLVALLAAARGWDGASHSQMRPAWARWELAARALITIVMAAMALASFLLLIAGLYNTIFQPPSSAYLNDVISFSAANAHATLAGRNPYTDDANFIPTLIAYPQAPPTPLQGPVFGYGYTYPLQPHVFAIDRLYVHDPARYAGAFDPRSLHSYPALAFLIYIPLFLVGVQNVMWVNIAAYVALFVWLVSLAERGERGWVAFTALAALTVTFGSLLLETEVICLLFLLPAWRLRARCGWASAILLGLACAFKQYCWFFAPLYLLDTLRRQGWREAVKRGLVALLAFLAPNAPFIFLDPGAWWRSMWLPLGANLFPQGMGLVTLALGHWLPALPQLVFTILEVAAVAGALWVYARHHQRLSEAAPLLALLPFVFAFRSPPNYFAIAPWLALFAWLWLHRARREGAPGATNAATSAAALP